jgi:hypothetical protein
MDIDRPELTKTVRIAQRSAPQRQIRVRQDKSSGHHSSEADGRSDSSTEESRSESEESVMDDALSLPRSTSSANEDRMSGDDIVHEQSGGIIEDDKDVDLGDPLDAIRVNSALGPNGIAEAASTSRNPANGSATKLSGSLDHTTPPAALPLAPAPLRMTTRGLQKRPRISPDSNQSQDSEGPYCICGGSKFGEMVRCAGDGCEGVLVSLVNVCLNHMLVLMHLIFPSFTGNVLGYLRSPQEPGTVVIAVMKGPEHWEQGGERRGRKEIQSKNDRLSYYLLP